MRHPTRNPTTIIRATTNTFRARSAVVRPVSTAARDIGRARNRSISPLFMSVARPMAVASEPNTTVCTKIPAIRKSTYGMPPAPGSSRRTRTGTSPRK